MSDPGPGSTIYDEVGGLAFFEALVDRFYDGVAGDPELLAVYPTPEDLGPARRHLALFLAQYWGGPPDYSVERGHPALRMRHAPFAIGTDARDRWLLHMRAALRAMDPPPTVATALEDYLALAADALRNRED
jgi:hemoglobin